METCSRNHTERERGVDVGGEGKGTLQGWWCARGRETHTQREPEMRRETRWTWLSSSTPALCVAKSASTVSSPREKTWVNDKGNYICVLSMMKRTKALEITNQTPFPVLPLTGCVISDHPPSLGFPDSSVDKKSACNAGDTS